MTQDLRPTALCSPELDRRGTARLARPLGAALIAVAIGCATPGGEPESSPRLPAGSQLELEVDFDAEVQGEALQLTPRAGGVVTLEDGDGDLVAAFRLAGELLEVEAANGERVGVVARSEDRPGGLRVLQVPGGTPLYELRPEPDGDVKLTDAAGRLLYELKLRDYGFKVVDAQGSVESRVRARPEKISIRNPAGVTVLTTREPIPPLAAACISLREFPLEYAGALAVAVIHWSPPPR